MNQQRLILVGSGAILLIILLLLLLGTKIFLLLLAGVAFYGAYRFSGQLWVQRILAGIGGLFLLIWLGDKIGGFIDNLKSAWLSLFSIPFTFLIPIIILLGIWIWKRGYGFLFWRVILCGFLLMSWVAENSKMIFDGYEAFKKNIPTGFGSALSSISVPKEVKSGSGKLWTTVVGHINNFGDSEMAKVEKNSITIHQDKQLQSTWLVDPSVTIYNCGSGSTCTASGISYTKEMEVISMGEHLEQGKILYEKCNVPDPITGEYGKHFVWIRAVDLKPVKPAPAKSSGTGKWVPMGVKYDIRTHGKNDGGCWDLPKGQYQTNEPTLIAHGRAGWQGPKTIFNSIGDIEVCFRPERATTLTFARWED